MGIWTIVAAVTLALLIGFLYAKDCIQRKGSCIRKEVYQAFSLVASKYAELYAHGNESVNFQKEFPQCLDAYKFVIVNWESGKLDNEVSGLDQQIRASNPEEVTTLICLKRKENFEFSYTSGSSAYRYEWEFVVIDDSSKKSKEYRSVFGSMPPKVKALTGDAHGSEPKGEIVKFCENYANLKGDVPSNYK